MNIEELSQALNAIADEVTDDSKTRLSSVDRRVQIARRSKVAVTVVTTCAVAMAAILLPNWGHVVDSDPAPVAGKTIGNLAVVKAGDLVAYKDAAGVRLLKARSAPVGAHSITLTVTPETGNLGWTQQCQSTDTGLLQYHLSVNGMPVPSAVLESLRYSGAAQLSRPNTTCDAPNAPMQVQRLLSLSPKGNMAAWRHFRVQVNVPATFQLSVTSTPDAAGRAALAKARLALGVFEVPRHPALARGVWIDRHIVDPPGVNGAFQLVHRKFTTVSAGRTQLTVPVPRNGKQTYVRTFIIHGQGSGVTLTPGATTPQQLRVTAGTWSVEKLVSAGVATVQAAVAVAPSGVQRRVAMLVYQRYH